MSSLHRPVTRIAMILSIIAIALAALAGGTHPVGAATSHTSSAHAKSAHGKHAKAKKHSSKHKSKKHKSKKRKKSKKAKAPAKRVVAATPKVAAASPYAYKKLRHRYTFTGKAVDQNAWGVYNTTGSWSKDKNARRPELVTVSGNMLHVRANGPQGSGLCLCRKAVKPTKPYGRYEIRARASADADHGFAMLLWPNAENWPVGGEIDIAEYDSARSNLWTTLHYSAKNKRYIKSTRGNYTQWHTYGVQWSPKAITYYLDGRTVMTVTDPAAIPRDAMHLALQAGKNNGTKNPRNTSATLDVAWINEYA